MLKITAQPNSTKNGFHFESEYNKARLLEWMKIYKWFEITPLVSEGIKGRRYLEGAVIPEYCKYQYNIDPRDPARDEARRMLFKTDFNYEIKTDRNGDPKRVPLSSKGKANEILTAFTNWATENGCKIPNPKLYKLWRDKWKTDMRFPTFHDFLFFLKLDCDAMPSNETLAQLEVPKVENVYPEQDESNLSNKF